VKETDGLGVFKDDSRFFEISVNGD